MIDPITIINSLKEVAETTLKEVAEGIKASTILNTLNEISNLSLESLKLRNEESKIIKIKTINDHLEGKRHPESGVLYLRDRVKLPDGRIIEGVFPVFESMADIQLPEELWKETDAKQMKYCNEQLKKMIEENPELRQKFTERQLEQIRAGRRPDGYTWHHHQQTGKMQLVDSREHNISGHTGGKSIWGGR